MYPEKDTIHMGVMSGYRVIDGEPSFTTSDGVVVKV
jgi:hypothetical protein